MNYIEYCFVIIAIWNTAVFALYGADKRKARRDARRISEKTLLLAAALMGGPGAILGMYIFHHKTKHPKFVIGVSLFLIMNIAAVIVLINFKIIIGGVCIVSLSKLPNIGKNTEHLLIEAGIETPEQLKAIGAKEALLRIRLKSDPEACVRVLYGLQGAIDGVKDTALDEKTKQDLLVFFRTL